MHWYWKWCLDKSTLILKSTGFVLRKKLSPFVVSVCRWTSDMHQVIGNPFVNSACHYNRKIVVENVFHPIHCKPRCVGIFCLLLLACVLFVCVWARTLTHLPHRGVNAWPSSSPNSMMWFPVVLFLSTLHVCSSLNMLIRAALMRPSGYPLSSLSLLAVWN